MKRLIAQNSKLVKQMLYWRLIKHGYRCRREEGQFSVARLQNLSELDFKRKNYYSSRSIVSKCSNREEIETMAIR